MRMACVFFHLWVCRMDPLTVHAPGFPSLSVHDGSPNCPCSRFSSSIHAPDFPIVSLGLELNEDALVVTNADGHSTLEISMC